MTYFKEKTIQYLKSVTGFGHPIESKLALDLLLMSLMRAEGVDPNKIDAYEWLRECKCKT